MQHEIKKHAGRGYLLLFLAILTLTLLVSLFVSPQKAYRSEAAQSPLPKYIFVFLADGAGVSQMEITRKFNQLVHNEGMVITDKIIKEGALGLMTTHADDSLSTDSAAAATAYASGCKAKIGALGICADGTIGKTAMEFAKERGLRIGLVTNSTVYDASPAAFLCHVPNRRDYTGILNRYLELEPDIILGGGRNQFLPRSQPGSRRGDETDFIAAFTNKGYHHVSNKNELEQAQQQKVLGLFSLGDMSFAIDRDTATEPSFVEMTQAAIRLLHDNNSRGFFLFIENENVDTAGHETDIAALIREYREFDRAVALAYEFYRKYPRETLILVTSDHDTGGLGFTLALKDMSSTRGSNQIAGTVEDLKKIQSISISLRKAAEILGPRPTSENIDNLMKEHFAGFKLAPEFKEAILKQKPISHTIFSDPTKNALGMMISNNTQAYWLTTAHTNQPVFVTALGAGAQRFKGYFDNADFGKNLRSIVNGQGPR